MVTRRQATATLRAKCIKQGRGQIQMRADQLVSFLDEIDHLDAQIVAMRNDSPIATAARRYVELCRTDGLTPEKIEAWEVLRRAVEGLGESR